MTYARHTRLYGIDAFPEWLSPAAKRFWMMRSEAAIRAEERLRSGEAADGEVYDLMLAATGDPKAASDAYCRRLEARQKARSGFGGH